MAKVKTVFRCLTCGAQEPKWGGRCTACGEWNTLVEEIEEPKGRNGAITIGGGAPPQEIGTVDPHSVAPRPTGLSELDRVLGGGVVAGSVTLVGGEPGVGKSTLLLQVLAAWSGRALYVSAEESTQQVRMRADRLGAVRDDLWLTAETSLPRIIAALDDLSPSLMVVDSIQTISDPDLSSAPGTVVQVRECAHRLVQEAKRRGIAVVLVGHVTKEGGLAGPRVLEHVVDTVLTFEGERHHALRMLRAVKHRFGATDELGLFEMRESGLCGVPDASGLFLADRGGEAPGSIVVPTIEGHRPLLVELQALVSSSGLPQPRRSAQGLDQGRLSMLLAVMERRVGLALGQYDVFTSVVGGIKLHEPGADLAICLAVASSMLDHPLPTGLVACGEVGLGGEIRQVGQMPRRAAEAARLGLTTVLCPRSTPDLPDGVRVHRVGHLGDALIATGLADLRAPATPRPAQPSRPNPAFGGRDAGWTERGAGRSTSATSRRGDNRPGDRRPPDY